MKGKDVYYINDIVALMPNLYNFNSAGNYEQNSYSISKDRLKFSSFDGDLMTEAEANKCFNDKTNYCRRNDGCIAHSGDSFYIGLSFKKGKQYRYMYTWNDYKYYTNNHGYNFRGNNMLSIPIYRFNGEDSKPATAAAAILFWLKYDLTPHNFKTNETEKIYKTLKSIYAKYRIYLTAAGEQVVFDRDKIFEAILTAGAEFDFLLDAKKFLESTEANATQEYIDALRSSFKS